MNKNEWLWVTIRIFGVFLLVMAIIQLPVAISFFYFANLYSDAYSSLPVEEDSVAKMAEGVYNSHMAQGCNSALKLVIYTLFGLYFACRGKMLHKILCRENISDDKSNKTDSQDHC